MTWSTASYGSTETARAARHAGCRDEPQGVAQPCEPVLFGPVVEGVPRQIFGIPTVRLASRQGDEGKPHIGRSRTENVGEVVGRSSCEGHQGDVRHVVDQLLAVQQGTTRCANRRHDAHASRSWACVARLPVYAIATTPKSHRRSPGPRRRDVGLRRLSRSGRLVKGAGPRGLSPSGEEPVEP